MPLIRGRYYANPAYGRAMERARGRAAEPESAQEDEREPMAGSGYGRVHNIHIQPHAEGVGVHVQYHGPDSDAEHDAPSGHWCTHNFDYDDHEGIGRFVANALAGPRPDSPGNR